MGFFRNLWDEALAGPTSDSGVAISKFRRYKSLSLSRPNNPPTANQAEDNTPVSRSIMILRTNSLSSPGSPSSPTGSSSPGSPFSATSPGGDIKKLTRRKSTDDANANRREPKSPTGYDWIVLTSLDR